MGYKRTNSYAQASGQTFERVMPGGYICGILNAYETVNNFGQNVIRCEIDIVDGPLKYFYKNQAANSSNGLWSFNATYDIQIPADDANSGDPALNRFKRFMGALESSNPNKNYWANDELDVSSFRGSWIGGVFGNKEYRIKTGERAGQIGEAASLRFCVSIDDIKNGNFQIPAVVKLKEKAQPQAAAPIYTAPAPIQVQPMGIADAFTPVDPVTVDQDLPF